MPTENGGKMMCEDDGIELEEFEDAEGVGYECPECHWIVMARELEEQEQGESERRHAVLYMATKGERYSPEDLTQIEALLAFARKQGWDVQGAVVEPDRPTRSAVYTDLIEDLRAGKIDSIIEWDRESNLPSVWDTEIPGEVDWIPPSSRLGDATGHLDN
jgi:hypothetical protein